MTKEGQGWLEAWAGPDGVPDTWLELGLGLGLEILTIIKNKRLKTNETNVMKIIRKINLSCVVLMYGGWVSKEKSAGGF